jgi:hypothetical protein
MTDYLAAKVKAAKDDSQTGKLRKGTYAALHQEALEHFELQDDDIPYDTIKHRISLGTSLVLQWAQRLPLPLSSHFSSS